jgi:hypothetical protein
MKSLLLASILPESISPVDALAHAVRAVCGKIQKAPPWLDENATAPRRTRLCVFSLPVDVTSVTQACNAHVCVGGSQVSWGDPDVVRAKMQAAFTSLTEDQWSNALQQALTCAMRNRTQHALSCVSILIDAVRSQPKRPQFSAAAAVQIHTLTGRLAGLVCALV